MAIETLAAELEAVRRGLVYRLQHGGERIRVTGADAAAWLQAILSQDLEPLAPGQGARSLLLDAKAAVLADLLVLRSEEAWLLLADADPERPLAGELERRIFREDVQLRSLENASEHLSLAGPGAEAFLMDRLEVGPLPARLHAHAPARLQGWPLRVLRSHRLGLQGWDLLLEAGCGTQGPEDPVQGEGPAGALRGLSWPWLQPAASACLGGRPRLCDSRRGCAAASPTCSGCCPRRPGSSPRP